MIHLILLLATLNLCWTAEDGQKFDFIVVGAGTAGSVVATRLAETKKFDVLLLEAGSSPPPLSDIPAMFSCMLGTKFDWNYVTVPQTHASQGLPNKRVNWPRGKMLGGSSSINGMVHVRGNKNDFDNWVKLGATGWSWEEMIPYFERAEGSQSELHHDFLGKNGPIKITQNEITEEKVAFVKSLNDLGYDFVEYNSGNQTGVHYGYSAIFEGQRQSVSKTYLEKVKESPYLTIIKEAQVERILFDKSKRATGVMYTKGGRSHIVTVAKEVILSGGTIGSPQLLLVSGVGPKDHLDSLEIPVISDRPVGENLQDHPTLLGPVIAKKSPVTFTEGEIFAEYLLHRKGPFAQTHLTPSFVNTKYADQSVDWPDMQILILPYWISALNKKCLKTLLSTTDAVIDTYTKSLENKPLVLFIPNVMRPDSRGTLRLKSRDIKDQPLLDPQYLTRGNDLKVLVEGVKLSHKIGQSEHFQKLGYRFNENAISGCEHLPLASDQYWECQVKHYTTTLFHPVGTCRLGPRNSSASVVDPELKVIGVSGLRVADASIMPVIVTGNTYATTVAIGEKVSDMILREHFPE